MSPQLSSFYNDILTSEIISFSERNRFLSRVSKGNLAREEDPISHTCAMIISFEPVTKHLLLVHHKKANSWLFPGGHIEKGELPHEAAIREAEEELGLIKKNSLLGPFGAQILEIENSSQICREHYDIFYALPVNPSEVLVDMREFLDYEWLPIAEVRKKIALKYYRQALNKFVQFMKW